uniref:Fucosyltransferase n=2 Tax=Clytia hemisphaerica TaxID=252671 RepID=A0A7M5VDM3_9CNID
MKKPYFILLLCIAILAFYFMFESWNQDILDKKSILNIQPLPVAIEAQDSVTEILKSKIILTAKEKKRKNIHFLYEDEKAYISKTPTDKIVYQRAVNDMASIKTDTLSSSLNSSFMNFSKSLNNRKVKKSVQNFTANMNINETTNSAYLNDTSFKNRTQQKKSSKTILVYTRYSESKIWPRMKPTDLVKELDGSSCGNSICSLTYNKTMLLKSDAVLFHEPYLPSSILLKHLRAIVPESQFWIWNLREPPTHLTKDLSRYNNIFNWTCTYSRKSEVYDPIFHIVSKAGKKTLTSQDFSKGRTKMIFAAINNCFVERVLMIKRLKKLVSFDVYGACGRKVGDANLPPCPRFTESCSKIMRKYHFYFAMENSYCDNYITEKYYQNGLLNGLIPIVLGGAHYGDNRVAISHSYINLQDFDSLENLTNFLEYLANNKTAYNKYFWWRDFYEIKRQSKVCAVCKRLWESEKADKEIDTTSYNSTTGHELSTFWSVKKNCKSWMKIISKYI